jgi:hypothetical protein
MSGVWRLWSVETDTWAMYYYFGNGKMHCFHRSGQAGELILSRARPDLRLVLRMH